MYQNKKTGVKYEGKVKEYLENLGYEVEISAGANGKPDLIASDGEKEFGIEVKSCRFFVSSGHEYEIGQVKQKKESWKNFTKYCKENGLIRKFVVVFYQQGIEPIIFGIDPSFVDERVKKSIRISVYQLLRHSLDGDPINI